MSFVDTHIHIILRDFNLNALTNENYFVTEFLSEYVQVVDEPTHISGSLIDHVYVHNTVTKAFHLRSLVKAVYFSDHEAVKIQLLHK